MSNRTGVFWSCKWVDKYVLLDHPEVFDYFSRDILHVLTDRLALNTSDGRAYGVQFRVLERQDVTRDWHIEYRQCMCMWLLDWQECEIGEYTKTPTDSILKQGMFHVVNEKKWILAMRTDGRSANDIRALKIGYPQWPKIDLRTTRVIRVSGDYSSFRMPVYQTGEFEEISFLKYVHDDGLPWIMGYGEQTDVLLVKE